MDNKDLVWDLESFRRRKIAQELILGIENQLCVYSSSVEQLYTAYDIFFPKEENRKLVILPNPYVPHDTFQGIPSDAVRPTGLFLAAADESELNQEAGGGIHTLHMIIPISREAKKYRRVPLAVGIKMIDSKRGSDNPFLPVVMKGDLREFNQDTPCLHLHSLNLGKVGMLSALERASMTKVISDRLHALSNRKKRF